MDIAKIYDEYVAEHYDQDFFNICQDARSKAVAQILKRDPGGEPLHILDLGMGTGELIVSLSRQFPQANFYGVELSEKMLRVATKKFRDQRQQVQVFHDDANHFGRHFQPGSMDLILTHFLLYYVDQNKVFAEIGRCLKKGGLFSIASSTRHSFSALQGLAENFISPEAIKSQVNVMPESLEGFESLLDANGFKAIESHLFRKKVNFEDFDHLLQFVKHSSWVSDPLFVNNFREEELAIYRQFCQSLFPFEDSFEAAIVLAEKR